MRNNFLGHNTEMGACFSCLDKTIVQTVPVFQTTDRLKTHVSVESQPQILDLRLCDVSIMTSHNSYINTLQHFGESSLNALQKVLNYGARCIELDLYRYKMGGIYVAHGKEESPDDIITTTKLDLDVAFEFLSRSAFEHTSDPLFIALELNVHTEEDACDQIANLIHKYFDSRIYKGTLTGETRIRDLIGKVIFMSGGGAIGRLSTIIHTQWSDVFQNISSSTPAERIQGVGTCIRVYPEGNLAGALSANFNPVPYLLNGATFVALNMCTNDEHMQFYASWFAHSRIVKKVERAPIHTA